MNRSVLGVLLCFLGLTTQAQAINTQHMQQRLDRAVDRPEAIVKGLAEKLVCKQDKKPICYASQAVFDGDQTFQFALVKISRPEKQDGYILFQGQGPEKWVPIHAGLYDQLELTKWKAKKVYISDIIAQRLIQKLKTAK